MTNLEVAILRQCSGVPLDIPWGAAVGAALESLTGSGYMTRFIDGGLWTYVLTDKGYEFLGNVMTETRE